MAIHETNKPTCSAEFGDVVMHPKSFRCHLAVIREHDGGYSAIVLNLPGVASCGDTEEEAIANVREAITGTILSYLDDSEQIPWVQEETIPHDAKQKWILVHV